MCFINLPEVIIFLFGPFNWVIVLLDAKRV